jgi:hypothetical protein
MCEEGGHWGECGSAVVGGRAKESVEDDDWT